LPVQVLHGDPIQADVELPNGLHASAPGATGSAAFGRGAECPEVGTSETIAVPEKPTRCALDIREARLVREVEKLLSRIEDELQFCEQCVGVKPDAAVERDQVAIEVVENLES
jgi:hypothetical protein